MSISRSGSNQGTQSPEKSEGNRSVTRSRQQDPLYGFGGDLFRMSPFALLSMVTDQLDRAFGQGRGGWQAGSNASWAPSLEVKEKDGNLVVCADLPGVDQKDVSVEVTDDMLTIQGERRREQESGEGNTHHSERSYGSFLRSVRLPEGAQGDQARAEYNNGVLEVTVPIEQPKSNRRQIPVQAGSSKSASGESVTTDRQEKSGKTGGETKASSQPFKQSNPSSSQ